MLNQENIKSMTVASTALMTVTGVLLVSLSLSAEPRKTSGFRWAGEEIFYSAEISGTEAARASIRAGKVQKTRSGASYIPISAKAITHGFFAKSYPVNDNGDTFIHPKTGMPIKADKFLKEDGGSRAYKVRYEPAKKLAKVVKTIGKKERVFERAVPEETYDAFSWLYALRNKPLKVNDKYVFYVYDGWKLSRLHIKVVGQEKVWTPLGYYPSIKLDIDREILNSRWEGKGKDRTVKLKTRIKPKYFATLYLSADEIKIPVRVFITSKMGDADFKLIKYTPPKS